jgi:multicomponent Na+:H+ antiporter subunit G
MVELILSVLVLLGSFFILIASVGLVRFSDLYGRLHASTKATSFGIVLMLLGASIFFNDVQVYIKTLLIVLFVYLTAPLAAHSIAKTQQEKDEKKGIGSENDDAPRG